MVKVRDQLLEVLQEHAHEDRFLAITDGRVHKWAAARAKDFEDKAIDALELDVGARFASFILMDVPQDCRVDVLCCETPHAVGEERLDGSDVFPTMALNCVGQE
jgi:hypothetical protein